MNTILLQPTDVLFFRDGRPMGGSLAGHGAAWPLPHVINAAFHAALHRAFCDQPDIGVSHAPARRENGQRKYAAKGERDRRFVDVWSLGPFPVNAEGRWFFPRPADAQEAGTATVTLQPARGHGANGAWSGSSLPPPLRYAVANTRPPEKEAGGEPWLSEHAFAAYLGQKDITTEKPDLHFLKDDAIFDREQSIGIAIDPATQTTGQGDAAGKIYSAHYLRLREGFRLGTAAGDGRNGEACLFDHLFEADQRIVVGGQQRVCTVESRRSEKLPLPIGATSFTKHAASGKCLVKWVLLTPAIWPEMLAERDGKPVRDRDDRPILAHHGGWLPNWIDLQGKVRLKAVEQRRPPRMHRKEWRDALQRNPGIQASLVAAIVPKPIPVTGWALNLQAGADNPGAKSTHLAVSAGAVYYFEAESPEDAAKLAAALNWHGTTPGTEIKNRRSTLLGEKGFGLGVCGTWSFFPEAANPAR
jgi:CRISPR type III-B/RAMP module-associated protein Cmr3